MSKFIDRLNKIVKGETTPMGFRRAGLETPRKQMQLVACVSEIAGDVDGADAVIVSGEISTDTLKNTPKNAPLGSWLKNGGSTQAKQLKEAGVDFVVFSSEMAVTMIEDKEIGKIIEVDIVAPDGVLRALASLPVEAILISLPESPALTWQDLITVQKFGSIPGKPLFVKVTSVLSSQEIEALWNAGVNALVVESNVEETRKAIEKADFTSKRKNDRNEPVLRQFNGADIEDMDDEDGEDD